MINKLTFLKNALLALLFVSLFSFEASAQQWDTVGVAGFSNGTVLHQSLDVHNDTAYVAYRDASNQNKLSVQMYDGSSWVDVGGQNISAGAVGAIDLLVVGKDHIYVAYVDGANSDGITLKRYNGTSWNPSAPTLIPGFSTGSLGSPALAYDLTEGIHIAYDDIDNSTPNSIFVDVKVQKVASGNWISLGSAGSGNFVPGTVGRPSMKFNSNGSPFIAYENDDLIVNRYTGSAWTSIASGSISSGFISGADLEIGSNGQIYVAFQDQANGNKTTVVKYMNSSWSVVGAVGLTTASAINPDLALDNNDNPYVAQLEGSGNKDVTVYKFNGTSWTDVGTGTTTAYGNLNHNVSANLEINNNVMYLSFADENQKSTVMKYELTTNINQIPTLNKDITIYPNPTKGQLKIEGVEGIESIRILTMDGKVMETITTNSNTISVETLPQGVYTIEVITTEGTGYKNFVKQ